MKFKVLLVTEAIALVIVATIIVDKSLPWMQAKLKPIMKLMALMLWLDGMMMIMMIMKFNLFSECRLQTWGSTPQLATD
jgi:hypothetical protein